MSANPAYHADAATATPAVYAPSASPDTIVLSRDHVWDVLHSLEQKIGAQDWELSDEEEAAALQTLVRDAALLSRLAAELSQQAAPPRVRYEYPITDPVPMQERLQVILDGDRDPAVAFSENDLWSFVTVLHAAVTECPVPRLTEMDEETGQGFYRLAHRAEALATAATGAGSYVYQRYHNMQRLRGEWPYGPKTPEEATGD